VLIIITVIAVVSGVVLAQADTSVRATVALRDQSGSAYNGDGAAQVAINTLRKSTFNNDTSSATFPKCFGSSATSDTLTLSNFYPASNGQSGSGAGSAAVACTPEAGTGAQGAPVPISSANKPGQAILTLGTSGETGQTYGQSNKPIYIHGAITSNSTIDSSQAQLNVTGGVPIKAIGTCTGPITPACTAFTTPVADPNYPAPTDAPAPPASLPACNNKNKIAEFLPGLYTTADTFNNCLASWLYFDPGTYYFDFTTGSHIMTLNQTAVGGTLTGAKTDTAPAVPNACVNPINSQAAVGVELVFGGDSQLAYAKGVQAEFCATYHKLAIPTVLYGYSASATRANIVNGAYTFHVQSGCVITVGGCDLVSDGGNGTKPTFFFEGFVYAPKASVNIAVNNTTQPYFNFGLVTRKLGFTTTGSACTPPACPPFISLPDDSPGYGTAGTIVNLKVYVCPGVSTCSSSGHLQLTARVLIYDSTGTPVAGARQMKVLSWSNQR
jgi:hypothetical protein